MFVTIAIFCTLEVIIITYIGLKYEFRFISVDNQVLLTTVDGHFLSENELPDDKHGVLTWVQL